jgi:phosphopentomutase
VIAYTPSQKKPGPLALGDLDSFADVGATVFEALTGKTPQLDGCSFLKRMMS